MLNDIMCPCGSKALFSECCKPFIQGDSKPEHCEQLMRSRYTAYSMGEADYLIKTWHPSKQNNLSRDELLQSSKETQWLRLDILSSDQSGLFGTVEFKAFFKKRMAQPLTSDTFNCLHEVSRFEKIEDMWLYVEGDVGSYGEVKVGRNDPCPCGSGKKYKKCCDK